MEAKLPTWRIPGHDSTRFPWRAPGDVDRALPGAAARRLYLPGALHESCRKGDVDDVRARLDGGASVDELDGVRAKLFRAWRRGGAPWFETGYNQPAVVMLLLQRGAQLELRDKARWWDKAPVDWALLSKSKACVQLLCAEATARGVSGGRGQVAPLRTLNEFFYSLTDEEVAAKVHEMNDKVVERTAKGRQAGETRENRATREVWTLRAE